MSTVICTISLKYLATMILIAMIVVWIAATRCSEVKEKQRKQSEAQKAAVITAIAIFTGQIFWWAIKELRSRIIWENLIEKQMEAQPRIKPSPKQRAASLMSN